MKTQLAGLFALLAVASAVALTQAQEPKPEPKSDPEPAAAAMEIPSTFRSHVLVDKRSKPDDPTNREKKLHSFTLEFDLNPVVVVFSRTVPKDKDAPLAKLISGLHTFACDDKVAAKKFGTFVTFLALEKEFHKDPKRDQVGDEIIGFAKSLEGTLKPAEPKLMVPLTLTGKALMENAGWNLSDKDITVVFYQRLSEVKRWEFEADKPDAAAITGLLEFVKKELKLD
jgi:hypothetical protein